MVHDQALFPYLLTTNSLPLLQMNSLLLWVTVISTSPYGLVLFDYYISCCLIITFCMRHSRGEMYICHGRLSVCVSDCLSLAAFPHYSMDPDVTWGNGPGCPLVPHYWADFQSVHGFRCCDNIHESHWTRNISQCLYSLCGWLPLAVLHCWLGIHLVRNRALVVPKDSVLGYLPNLK